MRPKTFVGLACIGVFGFFVVDSFGSQLSGYESFAEATANGRRAHVAGTWLRDRPTTYDRDRNVFSFSMADEAGLVRQVTFADPKPANFEDAEKVVVEGQMAGDVFEAEHILVKCPSKYNDAREFERTTAGETAAPRVPTTPALAR
ncbi:MAG TPA: cytochrome c maturation protein CcmE [Rubricoccaceae bacterium]|jgi:cytochrome c-type biogenesis protein CcmE